MRIVNTPLFDEVISGTGTTWYTPFALNGVLGEAEAFAIQALTTLVTGTATLTVQGQHSADDLSWIATPSAEISQSIANGGSYVGYQTVGSVLLHSKLRFAISLSGTSPACRLKLYFTGRVYGGRPAHAAATSPAPAAPGATPAAAGPSPAPKAPRRSGPLSWGGR